MKKFILTLIVFICILFPLTANVSGADNIAHNSADYKKVEVISRGKLINVIDYVVPNKYTVFMFYADWCAPCGPLKEKLSELANRVNNMALREINIIDFENPLVKYYNLPAIPYFLIYGPDGNFVERGPMLTKDLLNTIVSQNK